MMTSLAVGMANMPRSLWSAAALMTALLTGCGGSTTADESQVAAQVNDSEISVHQVQQVLQSQPNLFVQRPEAAARRALDNLIEQELAAQAARKEGLDHDPAVVQAMLVAQREVLARAYQDRLAAKAVGPSSDEVDRFYASRPELFRDRKLYILQELAVLATAQEIEAIEALATKARSASEIAELLRASGKRVESRQFVQASEDLPLGLLEPLSRLTEGQSLVIRQADSARILTLLYARSAPVDRRTASEAITAYLTSERRRSQAAQGMKVLRDAARIQYVGRYADAPAAAVSPAN